MERYNTYIEGNETDSGTAFECDYGNWYEVDDVNDALKKCCDAEHKDELIHNLATAFNMPELYDIENT